MEYSNVANGDGLASEPLEASDDTVTLHVLCTMCKDLINNSSEMLKSHIAQISEFGRDEYSWNRQQFPALHTSESLQESVRNGCHLCTLFYNNSTGRNLFHTKPSCTEYSLSIDPLASTLSLSQRENHGFFSSTRLSLSRPIDQVLLSKELLRCKSSKIPSISDFAHLVRGWLNTCTTEHHTCHHTINSQAKKPSRLIDISTPRRPFLAITSNCEQTASPDYVTLSHRWAGGNFLKLMRHNFESMKVEVPFQQLTQTFRDAILLSSSLGYKYVWIDALCIIQDSREDWARESNCMADVYRNGILNISVYANAPYSGCLQARNPLAYTPCLLISSNDLLLMADTQRDIFRPVARLLERGWIFQEHILSPRTVYVGDGDCIFECTSALVSEFSPKNWRNDSPDQVSKNMFQDTLQQAALLRERISAPDSSEDDKARSFTDFLKSWTIIVEVYSRTALSFPSDRLPALAAVATTLRDAGRLNYVAGHWVELLPVSLLWHIGEIYDQVQLLPPRQRFPSWSWASVEEPVRHPYIDTPDLKNISARLVSWHVTEKKYQTAVLGEVEAAQLRIEGVVHKVTNWSFKEEAGEKVAELQFADCTVRGSMLENMIQFEPPTEGTKTFSFLTVLRCCENESFHGPLFGSSEYGLLLAPYHDGFVRSGYMDVCFRREHAGNNDPFWGEGEEKEVLIY